MFYDVTFRKKTTVIFASFLLVTFIIGIASALQAPTLSRFLSDEVGVAPILVGLFYSINAIASVIGSFLLAKFSDKHGDRRLIVLFCCVMGIANSLIFAFTRHYFILITAGVFFAALASSAMPQIFALAREYAVKTGRNVVAFNSLIRAQLSLAWVIGPPLSFALAMNYGFTLMYLSAVVMFLVAIIGIAMFLPTVEKNPLPITSDGIIISDADGSILKNKSVMFLFLATVAMWSANMLYIIDMPLYVDRTLHLSTSLPGILMGVAAAIEIPVMLLAGYLVPYVGKRNLMFIAIVCGALFYIGIILFQNETALVILQLFNALFIGIVANIGIIYFQDLLPTRMGVASTLFNNGAICGTIIAGFIQGFVSDLFGHHVIYWIALVMISISLVCCAKVTSIK